MKIIVGLGNPGKQYENTWHNVGFDAVDLLAEKIGARFGLKPKLLASVASANVYGEKVVIVKPQTYMNLSGQSVRAVVDYYKVGLKDVLVIYDDLDIAVGSLRFREKGSSGTHNGMRNVLAELGSGDFPRARIGTMKDNPLIPTIDYVLSHVPSDKRKSVDEAVQNAVDLSIDFIKGETSDKLMCRYNGKK